MNNKGQIGVGIILVMFIGIIVSLALYQGTFGFIGTTTGESILQNGTFTAPANENLTVDLTGQELFDTPIVVNATGQQVVDAGNYTIEERISLVDGLKRITLTPTASSEWAGSELNISYTYGAEGYIDSAGGRSITLLIAIFAALAIAVVALGKLGMFEFMRDI